MLKPMNCYCVQVRDAQAHIDRLKQQFQQLNTDSEWLDRSGGGTTLRTWSIDFLGADDPRQRG